MTEPIPPSIHRQLTARVERAVAQALAEGAPCAVCRQRPAIRAQYGPVAVKVEPSGIDNRVSTMQEVSLLCNQC